MKNALMSSQIDCIWLRKEFLNLRIWQKKFLKLKHKEKKAIKKKYRTYQKCNYKQCNICIMGIHEGEWKQKEKQNKTAKALF